LKVKVDRNRCTGVGNCAAFTPTVFELDQENKAVVLDLRLLTMKHCARSQKVALSKLSPLKMATDVSYIPDITT
jgi:ferredoxin